MERAYSELATAENVGVVEELLWQTRNCPACGCQATFRAFFIPNDTILFPDREQIVQCDTCNFVYRLQVLHQNCDKQRYELASTYDAYLRLKNQPIYRHLEETKAKYLIQMANRFAPRKGTILDIGSGVGSVLRAAQDDDWIAKGIEPNPLFLKESRNRGLNVIQGFFPDEMPIGTLHSYECISMLDVLEHIINPVEFLISVRECLDSKGIILIQVPNLNSLSIRLDGEKNNNFCIGHWSYFTPTTLDKVLQQAGFEQIFLETYISEFDKIQKFTEIDICRVAQELTGKAVDMNTINIDWLHKHLLGYKIFGVYKVAK